MVFPSRIFAYLGEGTVVPEVALVREAVADKAKLALLYVLLDRVEKLLLGDLCGLGVRYVSIVFLHVIVEISRCAIFTAGPSIFLVWRSNGHTTTATAAK